MTPAVAGGGARGLSASISLIGGGSALAHQSTNLNSRKLLRLVFLRCRNV